MNRKRWGLSLLAAVLLMVCVLAINGLLARKAATKRQIGYESTLATYSAALKPGMTRIDAESYLHDRGLTFQQMCCVSAPQDAWADLVMIGKEKAPWYCNENNIYIAFEFETTEPHGTIWNARSSDRLVRVALFPWLEQCL